MRFFLLFAVALPLMAADGQKGIDFERARRHWSFRPLRAVPAESTIDGLMKPGEKRKVDKFTLSRRAWFDVVGLPPTPAEVQNDEPWNVVIDKLLASPHFGERWARHWLDCVRYAETDGHEFDNDKPNAWRYRDYVIRAVNSDLPYNRFLLEHLAGDLLPDKRRIDGVDQSTIATGFYWLGENINTPVDSEASAADRIDNQVDVLTKSFLGLTVACARCHDHKFDPVPTADYYALTGFLRSSRPRQAAVAGLERKTSEKQSCAGYDFQFAGAAFECVEGRVTSGSRIAGETGMAISNSFVIPKRFMHVRMAGGSELRLAVDEYRFPGARKRGDKTMGWVTVDLQMVEGRTAYFELADLECDTYLEIDKVVFSAEKTPPSDTAEARPPKEQGGAPETQFALAMTEGNPLEAAIFTRGNYKTPGAVQPRRFLQVFSGTTQSPVGDGSGRLDLANRVLHDAEPLVARVAVNRIWSYYFGKGIVATPDNFGLTGEPPTNPDLLDWLAAELIRSNWSMKHIHRLILNSEAYQTRSPVRRLDSEALRDAMLAVSGTLKPDLYGPSEAVYVSAFMDGDPRGKPKSGAIDSNGRRAVYVNIRRNYLPDSLLIFDHPQPISTIGKRNTSVVSSQALYMLNNEFVHLMAERWAAQPGQTPEKMYWQAFGRPATPDELAAAAEFLRKEPLSGYAHVLLNTTEFSFLR